MFKPRLYNEDEYINSLYVDTIDRYNNFILPQTLSEYNIQVQDIINNKEQNKINYNSLTAISTTGCIVPLKKYVINLTWKNYYKKQLKLKSLEKLNNKN